MEFFDSFSDPEIVKINLETLSNLVTALGPEFQVIAAQVSIK